MMLPVNDMNLSAMHFTHNIQYLLIKDLIYNIYI